MTHLARSLCALLALAPLALAQNPADDRLTLQGEFLHGTNTVEKIGSIYYLKFRGTNSGSEYQIDVNHVDVKRGMLRVYERYSDCFPMTQGGITLLALNGSQYLPVSLAPYCTMTADYISGNSVVLEYTDAVPGNGIHHRRHTLTIRGKVLSVTVEDLDHGLAYNGNYSGMWMAATSGTEDVRTLPMQGALAQPLFMFRNGNDHWFCGEMLDIAQSNASDWTVKDFSTFPQGANSIDYSMPTTIRYYANTQGQLSAPVKDTWNIAISQRLADVLLAPTQPPSPYRAIVAPRTMALFGTAATSWADYRTHLQQFASWGLDDITTYCFEFWSAAADDPPAPQNQGPDWYPARDPNNFTALCAMARSLGIPIGVYMSFSTMPTTAPPSVYDPSHIARTSTGAYATSPQWGTPLNAISASGIHAHREALLAKQNYGVDAGYLDIQSYGSPSHGVDGDHIDQLAGSPWAKTMHDGILAEKTWLRDMTDIFEGPMIGEGSIATQHSNLEWLWAGYVDSVQRVINSGSGTPAFNQPQGDLDSPTLWPVIPEFELRVMLPLQANHGNGLYERFFSRSDTGMTNSTGHPIFPLSEASLDRYRIYEITYGHTSFFVTSGPFDSIGNEIRFADMVKEYYMMHALQGRYFSARVREIKYLYQGTLLNFERVFALTENINTFRDPKLYISYKNGLEIYLNHSTTPWSLAVGGTAYTIPTDGWVAHQPSTGFVAFSAIPPGTGGQRIDYCLAPGEYEYFDGRGNVSGYGTINSGSVKRSKVSNFIHGTTVQENANGSLTVTTGVAPVVTSVEVLGDASIAPGDRVPLKALAHFNNGAFRNVTTLVTWTSSNPAVATVNQAGALIGVAPGTTDISITNFGGASAPSFGVTVQ